MIIDCHGHYTTAPDALGVYRDAQKAALKKATDLALQTAGPKAAAQLTEWGADKVRGLIEQAVLKTKQ